jgi:hypothetical protein
MELVVQRDPFGKTPKQTEIMLQIIKLSVARKTSINIEKKRWDTNKGL